MQHLCGIRLQVLTQNLRVDTWIQTKEHARPLSHLIPLFQAKAGNKNDCIFWHIHLS
jgi:hypothetical protein